MLNFNTGKTSQNTDCDMWEVLQIDKTLRIIEDKLVNNNTKLTEIDRHIKNDSEKLIPFILKNKGSYTELL